VQLDGWYQISGDLNKPSKDNVDEAAMLEQLIQAGPYAISIDATSSEMKSYKAGVANPAGCKSGIGNNRLNHAVLLVGFGSENGQDYWKIKNSWGSTWGENGYYRIVRGSNKCGVAEDAVHSIVKASPMPTPSPTPTPTPSPIPVGHYGPPPCSNVDEVEVLVKDGVVCAKLCASDSDCPTDLPAGVRATPSCSLDNSHCGLKCGKDSGCPDGAECLKTGLFTGFCAYGQGMDIVA